MKANETKVEKFLSSNNTQFVIPVYQRNYDWNSVQCKQLLNDILRIGTTDEINAHFIGSIVYIHDDVYTSSGTTELTIIDGQQRLTSLTLIYLVIYQLAKNLKDEKLEAEISETYLTNKFAPEKEKLKLRPTENNDKAIKYLLRGDKKEEFKEFSKVIENFAYFKNRINKDNLQQVRKGLSKLMFVEISLERGKDDPQRIFESLNSTGLELSQADLIRNYILMELSPENQKKIYENYWAIIEKLAKDENSNKNNVSDFIRDYLTLTNKKIPNKNNVYLEFKEKFPPANLQEIESNLKPIKSLAEFYNKLLNPKNEVDKDIKLQLEYINRLEINVAYPFLIKVYEDYSQNIIDKNTFIKILDFIQAFIWRRFIVGLPTNALNKIFMNLYGKIEKDNYLASLQQNLLKLTGSWRFPKNNEVLESLKLKDVYNIKPKNRTYLLERLENFENNEPVIIEGNSDITIEHIFPQNPDPKWKIDLGADEYNQIKETYINTIGNLTLSGNNGKLGNKPFLKKRDLENAGYKDSRLWLNKHLSTLKKWDIKEIEKRFKLLAERFLKIWQMPEIDLGKIDDNNEVNIFDADDPTGKKIEYSIFFDQKIKPKKMVDFYIEIMQKLFELEPQAFIGTELGEKLKIYTNEAEYGNLNYTKLSDRYFIFTNTSNADKFDKIKYALKVFHLEDQLTIKYTEKK